MRSRVNELSDWNQVSVLTVAVDRLSQLVTAGFAVHRRCRARHVADRRRRNQSGDSGRGGRGKHPRSKAGQRNFVTAGSSGGAEPQDVSHRGHPAFASCSAEQGHPARSDEQQAACTTMGDETAEMVAGSPPANSAGLGRGLPSGTREVIRKASEEARTDSRGLSCKPRLSSVSLPTNACAFFGHGRTSTRSSLSCGRPSIKSQCRVDCA